jgi:hypothetical protein
MLRASHFMMLDDDRLVFESLVPESAPELAFEKNSRHILGNSEKLM